MPFKRFDKDSNWPTSYSKLLGRFLGYTSVHGLPRMIDSNWTLGRNPCLRKFSWVCLFLVSIGALVAYTLGRIDVFQQELTTNAINIETNYKMIFPDITLCPLNIINRKRADNFTSHYQIQYKHLAEKDLGHRRTDFVSGCKFNRVNCLGGSNNITWSQLIDKDYGNCFTFSVGEGSVVKQPNKDNGMELRLAINADLYQAYTEELGFVVRVHEKGTRPEMSR